MSKIIEVYGLLMGFCMCILVLIGIVGIGVSYLPLNKVALSVVEVIEINDGLNESANVQIDDIRLSMNHTRIEIEDSVVESHYKRYTVSVSSVLIIPILNLGIPIQSIKLSKKVLL